MVKLKFIIFHGALTLRISSGKERSYKNVSNQIKGHPNLKHWKEDKETFSGYAEFYKENNKILADIKASYQTIVDEHPTFSAKQVSDFKKAKPVVVISKQNQNWTVEEYRDNVSRYLQIVINREQAKQGCNFQGYQQTLRSFRKVIVGFDELRFSELDYNTMVSIACTFAAKIVNYWNCTKCFRAMLGRAHKDPDVNFSLNQIGDFKFSDYNPHRYESSTKRPDILNREQLKMFLETSPKQYGIRFRNKNRAELFHDFCVFMLHTFLAPCDVIKAKTKDITKHGTLVARRKKTHRQVEIPVTPTMRKIIDKYHGQSKYGYIFPIMDDEKERKLAGKDAIFKYFRTTLNKWLSVVGNALKTDYPLHAYVFRHTAITIAIDNGLPISFVANAAGTSIVMIQKHYYNGDNDLNRSKLVNAFMNAGGE